MPDRLLLIRRRTWRILVAGLAERGRGERESGAFLLSSDQRDRRVREVVFFDDLDPDCLQGHIDMSSIAFSRLWRVCESKRLRVIADVHTHPAGSVAQSPIDARNPMIAIPGHIGIIAPHFALGRLRPRDLGVHIYESNSQWSSLFDDDAGRAIGLTWW